MVGVWRGLTGASKGAIDAQKSDLRYDEHDHGHRPVTRSQSSKSAGAPWAQQQGAVRHADGQTLSDTGPRFVITASAQPDVGPRLHSAPLISVSGPDGAPTPPGCRVKVILYPLARPGRGYLSLRCFISSSARRTYDTAAAAADCRAAAATHPETRSKAQLVSSSGPPAASTHSVSGQQQRRGNDGGLGQSAAVRTALQTVVNCMNCAAYALAALQSGEMPASQLRPHSRWADIITAALCSGAAGAGLYEHVQPEAWDGPPREAGRGLLRGALRRSALLAEISRRLAILRRGALLDPLVLRVTKAAAIDPSAREASSCMVS